MNYVEMVKEYEKLLKQIEKPVRDCLFNNGYHRFTGWFNLPYVKDDKLMVSAATEDGSENIITFDEKLNVVSCLSSPGE